LKEAWISPNYTSNTGFKSAAAAAAYTLYKSQSRSWQQTICNNAQWAQL